MKTRSKRDILLAAASRKVELDYWIDAFKPGFIRGFIPYDCTRKEQERVTRSRALKCGGQLYEGLARISNGSDVRLHLILLAAFVALLLRRNDADDITVGVPIYRQDTDDNFVNTAVVLRCSVSERATFKELLLEVRQRLLQAYEHQNYPLEILCDKLGLQSTPCYFPLFDAALLLENIHDPLYLGHLPLNMTLVFRKNVEGELTGELRYNANFYEELTISGVIDQYLCLLTEAINDVDCALGEMAVLHSDVRRKILEKFNDTATRYPRDELVHRIFGRQAEAGPNRVAVIYNDVLVTYRWLAAMASGVVSFLRRVGMAPGMIVGVLSGTSPMALAAYIGILEAGGIYLPLDVTVPPSRQFSLLKDCAASYLLAPSDLLDCFPKKESPCRLLVLEDCIASGATGGVSGEMEIDPRSPAYVMFKSDSSGVPRGVLVSHRGILRLVKNTTFCDFSTGWRMLQTGAPGFDASTLEIWGSLLNGMTLCLPDKSDLLTPAELKRKIEICDIRCMWMTSSLFNQIVERDILLFRNLRILIVTGDSLASHQVNRVVEQWPEICLFKGYGPTENTALSTIQRIGRPYQGRIPIGAPISNSTAYVVDARGRLVPPGVPGELWVGGDGVALGYLNDPELTVDRFLSGVLQTDIYRTGDRARWLPNGTIDLLEELGEIKAERIGIDDDFLSLGGHSMKAATLVTHSSRARPLPVEDRDCYPLCPAQERMYALWKWDPELLFYNVPFAGRLIGALDVPRMRWALKEIVRRHEALRTYYCESDGEVVQRVLPAGVLAFDIEDINGGSIVCSESGLKALYKQFLRPFDMNTPPLFRVGLARVDKENHIFLVDVHHSVFDGTSLGIFLREFLTLYSGESLGPLSIQYRDYPHWLRDIQASGQLHAQKRFWLDRLDGCHAPVPLPVDFPEAETGKFRGGHLFFRLDRDVKCGIKALLVEESATLHMFMLAVFNVLLSIVTGLEDIIVGTPITGRGHAAFLDSIGMYVNLLALRNFPSAKKKFRRFLAEVKENALASYQHQNYHYVELIKALKERGQVRGNKLVNVTMAMQNVDIPKWDLPGLQFQPLDFEYNISKYDLTFFIFEREDWIDVVVEYAADLIKAETAERFFADFKVIMLQALNNPDILLGDVETSFN